MIFVKLKIVMISWRGQFKRKASQREIALLETLFWRTKTGSNNWCGTEIPFARTQ